MAEQRLPAVDGDDGQWGDLLNQFIEKEHYNNDSDLNPLTSENGGHKTVTIQPGSTAAGTAPLKFISGPLMSSPEVGAIEFASDVLYFTQTTNATRNKIAAYDDVDGATGDTYYRNASGKFVRLAIGDTNEILTVTSGLPSWKSAPAGDITGPGSSTDNAVVRFDSTTGKVIQDSAVTIADTTGDITGGKFNTVAISGSNTPTLAVDGTTTVSGDNTGDQDLSILVPYTGATGDVSLGVHTLSAREADITDGGSAFKVKIVSAAQTIADKTVTLPNKSGTVAMLDDIVPGGDVLLASLYNGSAVGGILICSQYNPGG
jgi:hypothetical protein